MKKIIITEAQYNRILEFEKTSALITENRDTIYGVAKLMGVKLTGMNLEVANKALDNEKSLSDILSTLEDDFKFEALIKSMEEKGMENAKEKILKQGDTIIDKFNEICDKKGINKEMNQFIFDRASLK
jgi:hypothetical protein